MTYCKICDTLLSSYDERYLKDICSLCVDEKDIDLDEFDFDEIDDLNFDEDN